jgi:hypothetical protein
MFPTLEAEIVVRLKDANGKVLDEVSWPWPGLGSTKAERNEEALEALKAGGELKVISMGNGHSNGNGKLADPADAVKLRKQGLSNSEIGERLGISRLQVPPLIKYKTPHEDLWKAYAGQHMSCKALAANFKMPVYTVIKRLENYIKAYPEVRRDLAKVQRAIRSTAGKRRFA